MVIIIIITMLALYLFTHRALAGDGMAIVSVVTSPLVFGGSRFTAAVFSVVGWLLEFASGIFSASILFLIL